MTFTFKRSLRLDPFLLMGLLAAVLTASPMALAQGAEAPEEDRNAASREEMPDPHPSPEPAPATPRFQVTVTATRTPTDVREIGQSLTIITSEEIQNMGARDLAQVLETVPGFNVVRSGPPGASTSLFVRGGESDFNLVLVDGLQINSPGGGFDFADMTLTSIDRIEIIRGPASVLYGADAVTSVIHIITRPGQGPPSGNFLFEGGSFDTYVVRGGTQGSTGRLRYGLGLHYSHSDGFYQLNNDYEKVEGSANAAFQISPSSSVKASVRYLDSRYQVPTDSTGAVLDPNDFRKSDEIHSSVVYEAFLNSRFNSKLHYGFSRRDFQSFTLEDGIVDFFESEVRLKENRHLLDWQNTVQVDPRHQITAGFSYEREATETDSLARRSFGVYLQEQFSWNPRFFLTAGARYDSNDQFRSFSTGSISAGYLLSDRVKVRASFGNSFRAPGFAEILGFPDFGLLGNTDLKPEKNLATDFGVDYSGPNPKNRLSATVFFNRFSDLIEFSFFVPEGSPNYLNIEKARSRGLELEASLALTDRLSLGGRYTLTATEVTDSGTAPGGAFLQGEPLLRRPKHAAGLYGEYGTNRFQVRFDLKFKGRREDVQFFDDFSSRRTRLPGYWKTDFALSIPVLGLRDSRGRAALVFRGENLFNRDYTETAGFQSAGRALSAGVDVNF